MFMARGNSPSKEKVLSVAKVWDIGKSIFRREAKEEEIPSRTLPIVIRIRGFCPRAMGNI